MDLKAKLFAFCLFFFIGIFFWRVYPPLYSTDTYLHLATGRLVWETKQVPKTDTFTFIGQGRQWYSSEWLSGTIMYLAYKNLGENGLLLLRLFLGIVTIAFIYLTLSGLKIITPLKFLTTLTVAVALSLRMFDRPEIFSFALFGLLIYLFSSYLAKPKVIFLIPLPLIFLIWPNIHPYAPAGLAFFGFFLLRFLVIRHEDQKFTLKKFLKMILQEKKLFAFFILSLAAAAFVPFQYKRFLFMIFLNKDLFGVNADVTPLLGRLSIIKFDFWQNVPLDAYLFTIFAVFALIVFTALAFNPKKRFRSIADLCFFILLVFLSFKMLRAIPVLILLTSPLLAEKINPYLTKLQLLAQKILILIPCAILIIVMLVSIFKNEIFGASNNVLFAFGPGGQVLAATNRTWRPTKATQALYFTKNNLQPQRILTSLNWGNQTIWELEGKAKVFGDVVYEKQTKESLADYMAMSTGRLGSEQLADKYNADLIINTQPLNTVEYFILPAWQLPNWKLVYVDDVAVVYAREDIIKNPDLILSALQPQLNTNLKAKPEEMDKARQDLTKLLKFGPNAFAYQQLVYIALEKKDYQKAAAIAAEGKKYFPDDPNFYLLESAAKARSGSCQNLALPLSQAKRLAQGYYVILNNISAVANLCLIRI